MNQESHIKQHYGCILSHTGLVLVSAALLFLVPVTALVGSTSEPGAQAWDFLVPGLVLLGSGMVLWRAFRPQTPVVLSWREGGIIVLLSSAGVVGASAWPFVAILGLDVTHGLFESVSGWTTTGLSVVDVSSAGRMILLWRSTMELGGGAAMVIIMMSAILGPTGVGAAATAGRVDTVLPSLGRASRLVLTLYLVYAGIGMVAYRLVGMSWFDAVNHAFAAVSTGGFSSRAGGIGSWDSVAVKAVSLPLMILGSTSFATVWLLLRGKFRGVVRQGEVRLAAVLGILAATGLWIGVCSRLYPSLSTAAQTAVFETVSALTTTGFSTADYTSWNGLGILILVLLMVVGGGTCSAAGGLKQFRVHLLLKMAYWELRRLSLPPRVLIRRTVWEGEKRVSVDDARLRQTMAFACLYLSILAVGTLLLCAHGYSLRQSLFEFASALGTVGFSVGITSPAAPHTVLWIETLGMVLGRLEFLVVVAALGKLSRDIPRMIGASA